MKRKHKLLTLGFLLGSSTAFAVSLEVQQFENGQPAPAGYHDVTDGIEPTEVTNVSADPFVDYLIPNNSGSAGITAQKDGGQYITSSTVASLDGANNLTDPDAYQIVYTWDDGTPLPFGEDFYGVSWGGWSASEVATLETRVDLATDEEVTVYHWFNDGWNYGDGHDVLSGPVLTVTHYAADGTEIDSQVANLSVGGAEDFFGDHRNFYSAIIKATRTAAGEYLMIENQGANIGYKGTAVSLEGAADSTITVDVQKFADGEPIPAGYADVTDGIEATEVTNVSADPFVDYLIPNNSGSAGITAQKEGGQYITSSTVASLDGANNLTDPDAYQIIYEWDDGTPLPFGEDFYGVSWGGWSASEVATLETRVDLATDQEITIFHWFNDGWNYGDGHDVLSGPVLTVTHYAADDTEISSETVNLTVGGAESFFGDHRNFYSAIITATRTAAGEYIIIENQGANIGYKGTAVSVGSMVDVGVFTDYPIKDGWADTGDFMGRVHVDNYPWVYVSRLGKYIYAGGDGWFHVPN